MTLFPVADDYTIQEKTRELDECNLALEEYHRIQRKVCQFMRDLFNSQGTVKLSDIQDDELKQYLLSLVEEQSKK